MFEERYEQAVQQEHPSEALIQDTLTKIEKQAHRPPRLPAGMRLAAALVTALAIIVVGVRWAVPHSDVTDQPEALPTETIHPLAEQYTVQAGTPLLGRDKAITIPFSVTGPGINAHTNLYFSPSFNTSITRDYEKDYAADPTIEGEMRLWMDGGFSTGDNGFNLILSLKSISLCADHQRVTHHDFDLSAQPLSIELRGKQLLNPPRYNLPSDVSFAEPAMTYYLTPGEMLLDLGHGIGITAIAYDHMHRLVIQACVPRSLPSGSYYWDNLESIADGTWLYPEEVRVWYDDDLEYAYIESVYEGVTRENVSEYRLNTTCHPVDAIIEGPWELKVDLSDVQPAAE